MVRDDMLIFRPEWFAAYGLDKEKNFLQAPTCECGCGAKCDLILEDETDLVRFAYDLLIDYECEHCAIFAHARSGQMYTMIKTDNEMGDPVLFFGIPETDMGFFREWDQELNLHCYGLLIETAEKGSWKIVED
jgi:hypothetical protein